MLTKVKQQFRTFSLDRIKSLEKLAKSFQLDKDFDAEEYFHDYFGLKIIKEMGKNYKK